MSILLGGYSGLGRNQDLLKALGRIRNLEVLIISGYYAQHWKGYLEKQTGIPVKAERGCYRALLEEDQDNTN
jgi:hypothetical protein